MSIVSRLLAWHARCVPTLIALALMAVSVAHAQLDVHSRTTNFDTTLCGTTKCRPLVFKNSGATQITITSVDAFFAPFQLDPTTPFNFPKDIAPGDSLAFIVCYTPAAAGQNDAFTGLIRYDVNSTISYTLTGRSTGPALSVTVNNPNYGTVQIFNTVCLAVKLTNTGDGAMALGAVTGVNPPFSLLTLPPGTLAPGESADVLVCFTPSKEGAASVTPVFNYTACGTPQSGKITLNGLGALPPKVALGPVLQVNPDPLNFDTTLCGTTKCQTMTFRNLGSSPLNFSRIDGIILPFSLSASTPLAVPFTLQPNESRTVQFCYSPTAAPANDSQRVTITADNRVSLSIATVFDTSGSMTTVIGAGVTRIAAANAGGRVFLDNLVNDPARGIVDEAEVIRFSSAVTVAQGFSTNIAQLRNAVPASASGSTRIYDALNTAIDQLNTRNQPGRRVIVLLTDGDDDLDFSDPAGRQGRIAAMAARAANNVRIFTIGLGGGGGGLSANGINTLQQLAALTGGSSYFTSNPDTLVQIYQTIAQSLSRDIPGSFLLRGRSVAPTLVITPAIAEFDSVRVGRQRCQPITFANTGDAPLVLGALPPGALGFTFNGAPPSAIPPGGSATVDACFTPTRLRVHDTLFAVNYNSCRPPQSIRLRGVGYDSVVIDIHDNIIARPGSGVEFPIYLLNAIPAVYDVRDIAITLGYNKTLLAPLDPSAATTGAAGSSFTTFSVNNSYEKSDTVVQSTIAMSGGPLVNTTPGGVLVRARLLALLGNQLSTPVSIIGARFADGNPKVGIMSSASFAIDSMCYLPLQLINARPRYSGALKLSAVADPGNVLVGFTLPDAGRARIGLYDMFGRLVTNEDDRWMDAGRGQATLGVAGLPSGLYLVRVAAGNTADGAMIVITR